MDAFCRVAVVLVAALSTGVVAAAPHAPMGCEGGTDEEELLRRAQSNYAAVRAEVVARRAEGPAAETLYARIVSLADPAEGLALLASVDASVDYPRAALESARLLHAQGRHGEAKAALRRFVARCPDALDAWPLRVGLAAPSERLAMTVQFRTQLTAKGAAASPSLWPALWQAELETTPNARHPAVRDRIAADVLRLRQTGSLGPASVDALEQGYRLTGDVEGRAWLHQFASTDQRALEWAIADWWDAHPAPKASAPPASRREHAVAYYAALRDFAARFPTRADAWEAALRAAPSDTPPAEIRKLGETILQLDGDGLAVAAAYAARGEQVGPAARIAAIAEAALAKQRAELASRKTYPLVYGEGRLENDEKALVRADINVRALLALWRGDAATLRGMVEARTPSDGSDYWRMRARLAWSEKRRGDALAFYLKAWPPEDDVELQRLWSELGGTAEGMSLLRAPKVDAKQGQWAHVARPLHPPALAVVDGGMWKSQKWRGRMTVVVFWASWCEPCKAELPSLQQLYLKHLPLRDLGVVSINLDSEPGIAGAYLKEKGYSFPTLIGGEWGETQIGSSIPLTWILDRSAVVRREERGFNPNRDWVADVERALSDVAR